MMFIGLIAMVLCEVSFLNIMSPDNKKIVTGLETLRLKDVDNDINEKDTLFKFNKKTGIGSRKKGEVYKEDENGKKQYLCLLPTDNNKVSLRDEVHNVLIIKVGNKFRISNDSKQCMTIQDNKLQSEKCSKNKNQLFNIKFYKKDPKDEEDAHDAHDAHNTHNTHDIKIEDTHDNTHDINFEEANIQIEQTRNEIKKASSTEYKDDIDVFLNKNDKPKGKEVKWIEKLKNPETDEENENYQIVKPERYKKNRKTSVVIKPAIIKEKQIADIMEKTISTTVCSTVTETIKKMDVVTEYLPVDSTTTIKVPIERILPPINTHNYNGSRSNLKDIKPNGSNLKDIKPNGSNLKDIKPNVLIPHKKTFKNLPINSSYERQSVESDSFSDDKTNQLPYQKNISPPPQKNILPPPQKNIPPPLIKKPVKQRKKKFSKKKFPESTFDLSESSVLGSSISSEIDSSEERQFEDKINKIINDKHKIPKAKVYSEGATNPTVKSIQQKSTEPNKAVKNEKKSKLIEKINLTPNQPLTPSQNMTKEEYDLNLTTALFDNALNSTLEQDNDVFSGLQEELAATGLEEIIGPTNNRKKIHKSATGKYPPNQNTAVTYPYQHVIVTHPPHQHVIVSHPPHQQAIVSNNNKFVTPPMPVNQPNQRVVVEYKPSVPIPINQPNQVIKEQIVITPNPLKITREEQQIPGKTFKSQQTLSNELNESKGLDTVEEKFLSGKEID